MELSAAPPQITLNSQTMLNPDGSLSRGLFSVGSGGWDQFDIVGKDAGPIEGGYMVPLLPVDFHCHGVGKYDFTAVPSIELAQINRHFVSEGIRGILTLYLPQPNLGDFLRLMEEFGAAKAAGQLTHIAGVALEGPMLGSFGGTPESGVWAPTREEWRSLARCGALGLQYVVLSPDATLENDSIFISRWPDSPPTEWVFELLLEHGVRPALGHFWKSNPEASAAHVRALLDIADRTGILPSPNSVITDHLFNDMPRNFKHSWRTEDERARRAADLERIDLPSWTMENIEERAGVVPATIMRAAKERRLTVCLNFDGEHVDLAVSRQVVELLGAENIIAMTDRVDSRILGGQRLQMPPASSLLYQSQGIVAAGTQGLSRQVRNMRSVGLTEEQIWQMICFTPSRVLGIEPALDAAGRPQIGGFVTEEREYHAFSAAVDGDGTFELALGVG